MKKKQRFIQGVSPAAERECQCPQAGPTWQVWGTAARHGSTSDAARGALTWRNYPTRDFPREDWLQVISVREVKP